MADHNYSPQHHVSRNNDAALDVSREHRHDHVHHNTFSEKGGHDDPQYTSGTTFNTHLIPDASPQDHHTLHRGLAAEKGQVDVIDAERGTAFSPNGVIDVDADPKLHRFSHFYLRYRFFFHFAIFLLFTGWWIASLVLHRHDKNWIIPFLLWLAITLRLLFFHVPITIVTKPMRWVWRNTGVKLTATIPERLRLPLGAAGAVAVILIGAFASPESQDNTRANRAVSLFGLLGFLSVLWATSKHRSMIKWHTGTSVRSRNRLEEAHDVKHATLQ